MTVVDPSSNSHGNGAGACPRRVRRGVIGVLSNGSELLMIRRSEFVPKPNCWCFPGGHIESGETGRIAVCRELHEELGIEVAPIQRLGSIQVPDSQHILAVWTVRHVSGSFHLAPKEIAEIRWIAASEVRQLNPGLPSNERVLQMLGY